MASIRARKRADGRTSYQVMFRIDGHQVGETFESMTDAERFRGWVDRYGGAAARELRLQRSGQQPSTPTVAEWCRTHVERLSGITRGTRQRYLDIIDKRIAPTPLGDMPIDVVQRSHVTAWIREQEEDGASSKTIRNRHGLLSAAIRMAAEEGLREGNPCRGVRIAETEREPLVFLTHDEFAVLLAHVPERWKPLTVTLAGTGLRFGEATALRISDVHLDDPLPVLRVERAWKYVDGSTRELGPPKTKKGRRTVSLAPQVTSVLRPVLDGRKPSEFVFTRAAGGPVRPVDYYEDGWRPALAAANLGKRPRVHDLRHTNASWLIASGRPLTEVQHLLGHESIKTTSDNYGHLVPEAHLRAAESIEAALSQALPELTG